MKWLLINSVLLLINSVLLLEVRMHITLSSRTETEAIWQSIPGAQILYEIYGYWPTLHDAVIRAVNIAFASRSLEIILDYNDRTGTIDKKEDTRQRITLRWQGILDSKLRLYDGDLYGMDFSHHNGIIETRFVDYSWGLDGYILSNMVEVVHVEPSPDMSGLHQHDPAGHEIRLSFA